VEPLLDHAKVEDLLEELDVVGDRVDDGDLERAVGELAELREVDLEGVSTIVRRVGLKRY